MGPMKVTNEEIEKTISTYPHDFSRLTSLFSTLTTQFGGEGGASLTPAIKQTASLLVKAATTRAHNNEAAKLIFTAFQKILSDRSTTTTSRTKIVYFIANQLFKLYFRLSATRQFDSISKNIVSSGVVFAGYSKADRVGYRYYLGRYYLTQQNYHRARVHLLWAFRNCTNASPGNKVLILNYLITASVVMGIFPSAEILGLVSGLSEVWGPLIEAMRKGDYSRFHNHLDREDVRDFYDRLGVWWYLDTRCDLIIYRSLFRRTFLLTFFGPGGAGAGAGSRKLPTVKLTSLLVALRFSTADPTYDLDDVENLVGSLIDAGYIKGYLHHTQKLLVLDRRDERTFGFVLGRGAGAVQRAEDDDEMRYA